MLLAKVALLVTPTVCFLANNPSIARTTLAPSQTVVLSIGPCASSLFQHGTLLCPHLDKVKATATLEALRGQRHATHPGFSHAFLSSSGRTQTSQSTSAMRTLELRAGDRAKQAQVATATTIDIVTVIVSKRADDVQTVTTVMVVSGVPTGPAYTAPTSVLPARQTRFDYELEPSGKQDASHLKSNARREWWTKQWVFIIMLVLCVYLILSTMLLCWIWRRWHLGIPPSSSIWRRRILQLVLGRGVARRMWPRGRSSEDTSDETGSFSYLGDSSPLLPLDTPPPYPPPPNSPPSMTEPTSPEPSIASERPQRLRAMTESTVGRAITTPTINRSKTQRTPRPLPMSGAYPTTFSTTNLHSDAFGASRFARQPSESSLRRARSLRRIATE